MTHADPHVAAWSDQQRVMARCRDEAGAFEPLALSRPEDLLAHLEARAAEMGQHLALHKGAQRVSYRELNARANRLARAILAQVGPGPEPVALLFEGGPDAAVAMLAVWKAGKFFAMLDVAAPPERLAVILEDSDARIAIAGGEHLAGARAAIGSRATVLLDTAAADGFTGDDLGIALEPGALACLVYTSGTTGRPKGVMVGFACLAHRVLTAMNRSGTCRNDREAIIRSPAFIGDIGVTFNALTAGASAHFLDVRVSGLAGLRDFLIEEGITILSPGVSLFRELAAVLRPGDALPALRLLRLAGEQVRTDDLHLARRHLSPRCIVRVGYSSTETSAITDYFADPLTPIDGAVPPSGYAAPHVEILIVDDTGRPIDTDAPGEIVLRSPGLAQGYWRRPDETAARFVPDPAGAGRPSFRTGDLGRRLPSGMLSVLGRADAQVKVRGQRVEPAEVEGLLRDLPGVRAAAVAQRPDAGGQPWLCAYVVGDESPPSVSALRDALARRLPDYMVPQRFVFVAALPVTLNGKVDWRVLPAPSSARPDLATPYLAPRGPVESMVSAVWAEMLGIEPVGARDTFVDLGGDSLRAARVVVRIQERLGFDVPADLLEAGTVETMAEWLVRALSNRAAAGGAVTALTDEFPR